MLLGYVRPSKRDTAKKQIAALVEYGVAERNLYVEGRDGETLETAVRALRKGWKLVVVHLGMLAPPKLTTRDSPRRQLVRILRDIEAKGASVVETATGRDTATEVRDCMLLDAFDWLSGKAKGRRSAENGGKSPGRPRAEFTKEEIEQARQAWFDIRYRTWEDVKPHLPKGFTVDRAYKMFSKRHGDK